MFRMWQVFLLGLATIGAYGTAYYSISVLIPAIEAEEGWRPSVLATAFSLGLLAQGFLAVVAGRVFDRFGSTVVLLPSLGIGCGFLLAASLATQPWQFVATWVPGACVIGGGLYYNVTMPMATRLFPERRAAALSLLTLLGALASPIFLPIAGFFIAWWGWSGAVQGLVLLTLALSLPAALFVRTPGAQKARSATARGGIAAALREQPVHRWLAVAALAGLANSALILHQVPAMQAAGLSLAAASSFAGVRGAFQIPGRLLLGSLTGRLGVRGSIGLAYAVAMTAAAGLLAALLLDTGTLLLIGYFCVAGGMSLGLLSPLNGLFQSQVYGDERLGTLSGVTVLVTSVASATGAFTSALLIEQTGSHGAGLGMVILLQLAALAALYWQSRPSRETAAAGQPRASLTTR